ADLVGAPGQGGRGLQHQHGRAVGVGLDAAADLEAVDVGELDVEQHQRHVAAARDRQRIGAVGSLDHLEPGALQDPGLGVAGAVVVVDIQD
nr:hypothetical protein [Tanacetum cinerariifolium]